MFSRPKRFLPSIDHFFNSIVLVNLMMKIDSKIFVWIDFLQAIVVIHKIFIGDFFYLMMRTFILLKSIAIPILEWKSLRIIKCLSISKVHHANIIMSLTYRRQMISILAKLVPTQPTYSRKPSNWSMWTPKFCFGGGVVWGKPFLTPI